LDITQVVVIICDICYEPQSGVLVLHHTLLTLFHMQKVPVSWLGS